jgi:hypothetical protein
MTEPDVTPWQAFSVRLPVDLHSALKTAAEEDDRTMAQAVRGAVRLYLAAREDQT